MKTEITRLTDIQTSLVPDSRAIVAVFEYSKTPIPILDEDGADTGETTDAATSDDLDAIYNAAAAKAAELGIEIVWRATVARVPAVAIEPGESLAIETVSTVVKTSPDPVPEIEPEEEAEN